MDKKRKPLYALLILFSLLLVFWIVALFIPYEGEYWNLTAWLGLIAVSARSVARHGFDIDVPFQAFGHLVCITAQDNLQRLSGIVVGHYRAVAHSFSQSEVVDSDICHCRSVWVLPVSLHNPQYRGRAHWHPDKGGDP